MSRNNHTTLSRNLLVMLLGIAFVVLTGMQSIQSIQSFRYFPGSNTSTSNTLVEEEEKAGFAQQVLRVHNLYRRQQIAVLPASAKPAQTLAPVAQQKDLTSQIRAFGARDPPAC
jgi:hypothetical protein